MALKILLQSCETKSGTESLGLRLLQLTVPLQVQQQLSFLAVQIPLLLLQATIAVVNEASIRQSIAKFSIVNIKVDYI